MRFQDVLGHEEIKSTLARSVREGHLAHALLFSGKEGSAKLGLALALATYANCTNQQGDDACGVCPSCSKSNKLIHPDLHFVFPTSTNATIKKSADAISRNFMAEWRSFVAQSVYGTLHQWIKLLGIDNKQPIISKGESRQIAQMLTLKAFEGQYKIMLIWLPELMHPSAANAILKILEEPPPNTLYLLIADDTRRMLATILSRTQLVRVPDFQQEEVAGYLASEFGASPEKAHQVAFLAQGNLAEAVALLEEVEEGNSDFFKNWMRNCFKQDYAAILAASDHFAGMGKEGQKNLLRYAIQILREAAMSQYADSLVRVPEKETNFIQRFAQQFSLSGLSLLAGKLNEAYYHIERNANPKITFTALSIEAARQFAASRA